MARSAPPPLVTRWDLDKTYLRSDFSTARDLLQSALERPDQKRAVPGATLLLRELQARGAYVHVLSGSPKQLKRRLQQRLALDGIQVERFTLKPNLENLLRLRFRALKAQLGFKLSALLVAARAEQSLWPVTLPEILVGDDSEQDSLVYSLYADICQGAISSFELEQLLERAGLYEEERQTILTLAPEVFSAKIDPDFVILIHLDRQTPPSRFQVYGHRLVPFFNYMQAALILLARGRLDADAVLRVGAHLVHEHRFDLEGLTRSFLDLHRRGAITNHIVPLLHEAAPRASLQLRQWPADLEKTVPEGSLSAPPALENTRFRVDYRKLVPELEARH